MDWHRKNKIGYNEGPEGWEIRALRNLRLAPSVVITRSFFLLFLKLSLQTNMVFTLMIMELAFKNKDNFGFNAEHSNDGTPKRNYSVLSLTQFAVSVSFAMSVFSEMLTVSRVLFAFDRLEREVRYKVKQVQNDDIYCSVAKKGRDGEWYNQDTKGHELKTAYEICWRSNYLIVFFAFISVFLSGYAILKLFMVTFSCIPDGDSIWNLHSGCMPWTSGSR